MVARATQPLVSPRGVEAVPAAVCLRRGGGALCYARSRQSHRPRRQRRPTEPTRSPIPQTLDALAAATTRCTRSRGWSSAVIRLVRVGTARHAGPMQYVTGEEPRMAKDPVVVFRDCPRGRIVPVGRPIRREQLPA